MNTIPAKVAPRRIQRRRTRGWRMPERAVYVGRPTRWGNPYAVGGWVTIHADRGEDAGLTHDIESGRLGITVEQAVAGFRDLMELRLAMPPYDDDWSEYHERWHQWIKRLRGRDLACWCPLDQPCHADVLLELANHPGAAA